MTKEMKSGQQFVDELKVILMKLADSQKSESQDKETQGALKDLLYAILDAIPHAILSLKDRLIISANHAVETVFGWKPEELIGQDIRVLYRTEKEYEEMSGRFYPALEQRSTYFNEFPCRHKDGRDIICMVGASIIGELLKERIIIATYGDITASKRAEEELREYRESLEELVDVQKNDLRNINELLKQETIERKRAEELYKTLTEKSITAFFVVQDGKFHFINATAIGYAGYTPEELIGRNSMILVHPEDRETVKKKALEMLQGRDMTPYEYRIVTKQGQIRWVMQTITSILYEGKRAIIGNAMDISDRKRAEEEQRRREKLQGVLEMAGTVCHEMNQPMQIISGYSELLLMKTSENDPIYKKLNAITEQIRRMSAITRKLAMIKDYKTQDYIGFSRIIDIHNGSEIGTEQPEKKV